MNVTTYDYSESKPKAQCYVKERITKAFPFVDVFFQFVDISGKP